MRVNPISRVTFNGYRIRAEENRHVKFLYNDVRDAIREEGVTTVFTPTEIKFDKITKQLKEKLEKLKVVLKEDK